MGYKPTVVVDFDGVIHSYQSGWQGAENVPDPVVPGIKEAIDQLRELGYKVVVVSTRCASAAGMGAVRKYLRDNGIEVDDVMAEKPPALCYVDDRALCFRGNAEVLVEQVLKFRSWTEKTPRNDAGVSGLRQCKAEYWENGKRNSMTGWFHRWGAGYEEFETGPGNFTTAIVEDDHGKIRHCIADSVVFLDRTVEHPDAHGKWIIHTEHFAPYQRCSVCGFEMPLASSESDMEICLYKHCPECTARMDGDA